MSITDADDIQAKREGWALFACDDGKTRIQRLDDPQSTGLDNMPLDPVFADDDAAIAYVRHRAQDGSRLHCEALARHNEMTLD